ncbi:MAG: DNA-binding protein [Nitrososphaerota archaeon]|jgi:programmed cell death protein 5|nr:DNA-binding protein [Nitrososphaerota archaeon]
MSDDERESGSARGRSESDDKKARAAHEQMLRVVFTSEARDRLTNIRMVKPELADSIEGQIFQLASSGRLKHQISDEELKQMLGQLQQPKKEFKINWK